MENKELTLEEKRLIQLEMLDEIDNFCTMNKIRYSLAYGTLLGAVRHNGFIPWDDDVDIMMPLPDLLVFKNKFKSDKFEYIDVYSNTYHFRPFSRIAHKATYCKQGICCKSCGVCIDLYIIVGLPCKEKEYFIKGLRLERIYKIFSYIRSKLIFHCPINSVIGISWSAKKLCNHLLTQCKNYEDCSRFFIIAGLLKNLQYLHKSIINEDIFSSVIEMPFEGRIYKVIASYDKFLHTQYGDYMQLPPEEQRRPYHSGHYYYKS